MPLPLIHRRRRSWLCSFGLAVALSAQSASAQAQPPSAGKPVGPQKAQVVTDVTIDSTQLEAAARIQRAMEQMRDREQVELAEPKNKTVEFQTKIREKYRTSRVELFRSAGMADTTYTRIVQQISSDEKVRVTFEALLARLSGNR